MPAFFEHLRKDPANFYPNTDEGRQSYLDQSKAYIDAVYADVGKYFNILPKAPLEVRRVETWREETAPIAFYNQPTPDGSRPGYLLRQSARHDDAAKARDADGRLP